jgi:amino acid transporter
MLNQLFRKKSIPVILREAKEGLTDSHGHTEGLKKVLGVRDLTFMGIAAVIGAGIFSSIGNASYNGGPGVIFLYLFTAVACGFAALCYAEFASTVPVSGSAYTYSYVAFMVSGTSWLQYHGANILQDCSIRPGCTYPTG